MAIRDTHRGARRVARRLGAPAASDPAGSSAGAPPLERTRRHVGVVTRAVSWTLDAIAINLVAIIVGLGAELFFSIVPISRDFASVLKPVAAALYVVWAVVYFVVLWSWTGQTIGAQVMQIRLLTANGRTVKPIRGFVRWLGMNLAMVPLFAGFAPILFGRRGFPDWLARTEVLREPQLSPAQQRRAEWLAAHADSPGIITAVVSPASGPDISASGDGAGPPLPGPAEPGSVAPD